MMEPMMFFPGWTLSGYTYETAFNKFGQILDVVENESNSGAIEISKNKKCRGQFPLDISGYEFSHSLGQKPPIAC
jgi:hypothetical protein